MELQIIHTGEIIRPDVDGQLDLKAGRDTPSGTKAP
jgi:hypothetical protein